MNNVSEIVAALDGKPAGQDSWLCHCPAHSDSKASLSVSIRDGKILFYCHTGCSQESVLNALKAKGLWVQDKPKPEPIPQIKKKLVKTYDYIDMSGELRYQVCRFEPKTFRQRRPDGSGGWIWNLKDVDRILYRLPEIENADQIFICEGEKDADLLVSHGLSATTNAGGASKWIAEYSDVLEGKDCVILPDNDNPGRKHAVVVAESLKGLAKSVNVIELPGVPDKGDVCDWIGADNSAKDLLLLVSNMDTGVEIDTNQFVEDIQADEAKQEALQQQALSVPTDDPDTIDAMDEMNAAAIKLTKSNLNKDYTQKEAKFLLNKWNDRQDPKLSKTEIGIVVKTVYADHQKKRFLGIAEAVEKIVIVHHPDGTVKYELHLGQGRMALLNVDDLMSSKRTIAKIIEATKVVFNPQKQDKWLDLIRDWLAVAEEKEVAVEESELGVIKEILGEWISRWNGQKDSKHISLPAMIKNSCVIDGGVVYYTLTHLEEELRFKNIKLTRTLLCEFLRKLGGQVTEPRKRFDKTRIRTWEIPEDNCE